MVVKILLLFGAGASYGSGGIKDVPPLGKDLFNKLKNNFPKSWSRIPPEFSKKFKENFEIGMELVYDNQDKIDYIAELLKDLAIFFSRFKIDYPNENLYCKLFNKYKSEIEKNEILISTINYECLIESAIATFNPSIKYWGDGDGIEILKIHGSCNIIPLGLTGKGKYIPNKGVTEGPLQTVSPETVEFKLDNIPAPPAMSLYARGKIVITRPSVIKRIQEKFQSSTNLVKLMAIIGVNPNPDDNHIWDYIKETNSKIILIANKDNCIKWLKENRANKDSIFLSNKFENSYNDLCMNIDEALKE